MRKIFMRNGGFGDSIWVEPIVRHFLAQGEEVLLITGHESIYCHYPSDRLHINRFDRIFPITEEPISLNYGEYQQMHCLECFRMQAGIPHLELTYPQLHLSEMEKVRRIEKRYAILHLDFYSDRGNYRNVYGVRWERIVDYLREKKLEVIQISKEGKMLFAPWYPTEDFREIMSLVLHSELFIGLDSGPSHIAATLGVPSVIFFGSVNPKYRHLNSDKKVFLQSACPHAHCYHEFPYVLGQPCRLVEAGKPPPCCIQDDDRVIEAIRFLGIN